jgi:ribosome-associated translation inhibitor RaiA
MATKKIANRASSRSPIRAAARFEWVDRDGELRAWWSPVEPQPSRRVARPAAPQATSRRDLEIQTRRVTLDPAWRDSIEETIADLFDRHPQILRTHVTLTRAIHQKKERDTVSIVANAAGSVLRVEKRSETMERALRAALAALGRAATGLRRPKRALRPRRGREVVPAQPATLDVRR